VKVLYVNHTGHVSGGEHSLLSLLAGLPAALEAHVSCPEGPLAEEVRSRGIELHPIPAIDGSLKLHPLRTGRAMADMARAAVLVRRAASAVEADLVHANSIRSGLIGGLASRLGGPPTITHVRDCLPAGRLSNLTRRLVCSTSTVILANSGYTAERFAVRDGRAAVRVAHSPIDLRRFDPQRIERGTVRERFGLEPSDVAMGVVAQLTPWKGQEEAIRTTAHLAQEFPRVKLLLAGSAKFVSASTRYDNPAYVRGLEKLVTDLGVEERVAFLGEREDVPELMRALDVLLVPSWEEPFGRAVAEGMAMGLPVAATSVGGPGEIIREGEGLLLPPRMPERWAHALAPLVENPAGRERMGKRAQESARERLGVERHVAAVLDTYRAAVADA
jgi:L-malate glycosyltransferase